MVSVLSKRREQERNRALGLKYALGYLNREGKLAFLGMANLTKKAPSDHAAKSMLDYNRNSTHQAGANRTPNMLLEQMAKELSAKFFVGFNIGDFGCSHGLNSMMCIRSALEGYSSSCKNPHIQVFLNDLPDNNFSQVAKCVADPNLGFESHPIFKRGASVSTFMVGRSFYQRCLPNNHLHLAFSFNSLHWLETPITLKNSITLKSESVTPEEEKTIKESTTRDLVTFLRHRADELVIRGRLVMTILKDMDASNLFNQLWRQFLKLNNYTFDQFSSVTMPAYQRSLEEVHVALEQVQDQFKLNSIQSNIAGEGRFTIQALKASTYNTLVQGALNCPMFYSSQDATRFIDSFYEYLEPTWQAPILRFHLVVVERIQS